VRWRSHVVVARKAIGREMSILVAATCSRARRRFHPEPLCARLTYPLPLIFVAVAVLTAFERPRAMAGSSSPDLPGIATYLHFIDGDDARLCSADLRRVDQETKPG
jgi:hypothetical protein